MTRFAALVVSLVACGALTGADWPQWRGPNRDGISPEKGLLKKWPEGGPKLAWKIGTAGLGFSSLAIRDGKLYTLGSRGNDEIILALDAATGAELWTAKIGPIFTFKGNTWGDGPRGTPTLDGNLLFALSGLGDVVCVDIAKKGAELWRKNLIKDLGGVMMSQWGYSESPLVDGDHVLVTPGGKKGLVAALNKKTGALAWQSAEVAHSAPYSSMVAADINGVRQFIQLSYVDGTGGFLNGIAAKDGKLLWQTEFSKGTSDFLSSTPIVAENLVYITYGDGGVGGCNVFEIDKGFKAKGLYGLKEKKSTKNEFGGVVLIKGKIYGQSNILGWICQDLKTGKIVWSDKNTLASRRASTLAADDMLYLFTQEGEVGLAKASTGTELELVSEFKLPQLSAFKKNRPSSVASNVWNVPAIANGKLYPRDCELIYCYDIK